MGQYRLSNLESILSGESQTDMAKAIRKALKRDSGRPCPVQLGALADPFDNIERSQGWTMGLVDLLDKYKQPCRVSTKGKLFLADDYLDKFARPDLFWVAFSCISIDDEILKKIDRYAPTATERLQSMRRLSAKGVSTTLRIRPAIPNVTDSTKAHPEAIRELIEMAAESGAKSVSIECLFVPRRMDKEQGGRFKLLNDITGLDLGKIYRQMTPMIGPCIRPSKYWSENFIHYTKELTHKNGMHFTISDPVWKELNDFACCCGIPPEDPVFGNYEMEAAHVALLKSKAAYEQGKELLVGLKDIMPPWAADVPRRQMGMRTGPVGKAHQNQETWADKLRELWSDLRTDRGTLKYFQGALMPVKRDEQGDILYKYQPTERRHLQTVWTVPLEKH